MCISLIFSSFASADVSDKNAQLIQAAKDGNLPATQTLLVDGADINAKNKDGETPLMWAEYKNHTEIIKLLIRKGADINAINNDGDTALIIAARWSSRNSKDSYRKRS